MDIKFSKDNRSILFHVVIILYFVILCFASFYQPSIIIRTSDSTRNTYYFRKTSHPSEHKYRKLGSTEDKDEIPTTIRPSAACPNVAYGNLTYRNDINVHALTSLNELLIHLDHPYFVSPPNPDGPTMVDIGLYIHKILNLDPGLGTFDMEGYLDLIWCDAHTKFNVTSGNPKQQHMFLERDAAKELERIWWPAITFKNEKSNRVIENQEVIIDSDGTVEYREKFLVTLSSKFKMSRFPFDTQILKAEIESFAWNSEQLQFQVMDGMVGFSDDFEIPEFEVVQVQEHLETIKEARDRHPFSELVMEISIERNPVYYITKVFIPLGLIVTISWAVFWMDPVDLADRMAISFTGVLTSAAYQFVVSDILPRHVVTNTFLANFVLVSFLVMILCAVENVVVRTLWHKDHPLSAKVMDRVSRIVIPLVFVAICLIMASAQVMQEETLTYGGVIGVAIALPVLLILLSWYLVRRFKVRHHSKYSISGNHQDTENELDDELGQRLPFDHHAKEEAEIEAFPEQNKEA